MPRVGAIAARWWAPGAFVVDGVRRDHRRARCRPSPASTRSVRGWPSAIRRATKRRASPGSARPRRWLSVRRCRMGPCSSRRRSGGSRPSRHPWTPSAIVNPVGSATPFVAFTRADGGRWPAGTYRITARFWDSAYRLTERSWHLDFGTNPDAPVPLLLTGAGRWAGVAGHWAVLSTVGAAGSNCTVGETLASAREPEVEAMRPADLGAMCPGSAHVDQASRLIGVAFPPDAGVSALRLVRRFADGSSRLLDVTSALSSGNRARALRCAAGDARHLGRGLLRHRDRPLARSAALPAAVHRPGCRFFVPVPRRPALGGRTGRERPPDRERCRPARARRRGRPRWPRTQAPAA